MQWSEVYNNNFFNVLTDAILDNSLKVVPKYRVQNIVVFIGVAVP